MPSGMFDLLHYYKKTDKNGYRHAEISTKEQRDLKLVVQSISDRQNRRIVAFLDSDFDSDSDEEISDLQIRNVIMNYYLPLIMNANTE